MYSAKINVTLGIDEIINHDQIIPLNTDVIDEEVKCAIGRKIRLNTAKALKYSKENKLDILGLNDIFYYDKYKEYTNYINSGKTTDQFLEDVQISLDVRVEVI